MVQGQDGQEVRSVLEVDVSLRRGSHRASGPCEDVLPRGCRPVSGVSAGLTLPRERAAHASSASGLQSEPALPKAEFWGEISRGLAKAGR